MGMVVQRRELDKERARHRDEVDSMMLWAFWIDFRHREKEVAEMMQRGEATSASARKISERISFGIVSI